MCWKRCWDVYKTFFLHSLFMSLNFVPKCFTKPFITIRNLQHDNQLSLFRWLERLSFEQVKCDGAIKFLWLCQNFGFTPTFAKLDETKSTKWRQSSMQFVQNVILEGLCLKANKIITLKKQILDVYNEICQTCSSFHYLWITKWCVIKLWNLHFSIFVYFRILVAGSSFPA